MRHPDWQPRLLQAIAASKDNSFRWGEHDCCVFAARAADAITVNGDYVSRLLKRFEYHSQADIDAIMSRSGELRELVTSVIGESIPWPQARAGDVVLVVDNDGQEVLGVCEGSQVVCATTHGIVPLPMSRALCAWKIS